MQLLTLSLLLIQSVVHCNYYVRLKLINFAQVLTHFDCVVNETFHDAVPRRNKKFCHIVQSMPEEMKNEHNVLR